MMLVYQCLDIIATVTEALSIYYISRCFCKERRFSESVNKLIIIGGIFAFVFALTWFSELGAYKMPILLAFGIVLLKICYRDSFRQCVVSWEIFLVGISMLPEGIGILASYWLYGGDILVLIEGTSLMRWEIYVITLLVRMFVFLITYKICRDFRFKISFLDFIILTAIFVADYLMTMFVTFGYLNAHKAADAMTHILMVVFPALFMIIFLYTKNTIYLREQAQIDKSQLAQLQRQFSYYEKKQRDEEKVRSIYHDMKNHLLMMEGGQGTETAKKMAEQLRAQMADFEDYVHTGNEFLDIIIKDKAAKAREKGIDFSAVIHFEDGGFIEPLDISTIFGNAIDNAIEASEKLPEEQRVVLVKANRIRDFVSVVIENNCAQESAVMPLKKIGKSGRSTSKKDTFVHGFGISNMRKAAEKYGGTLSAHREEDKFMLKILIPVSEAKYNN